MDGDWEMVHGSDTESTDSITSDMMRSGSSSVIDNGVILSDHFSAIETTDLSLVETADSSYRSDDAGGVRNESGFNDFEENHPEIEALVGGTVSKYLPESEPIEELNKSWSDSGGDEVVSEEIVSNNGVVASSEEQVEGSEGNIIVNSGDESKRREAVWWKMPFVLLKYSALRIGPVWSVSIAAAVMGFVLLGRRLYNMKKKAQRFNLKVTIDEKKVSRVMSQAARLNEAFTEVRRVPVIRPALPSPGAWPLLSLR